MGLDKKCPISLTICVMIHVTGRWSVGFRGIKLRFQRLNSSNCTTYIIQNVYSRTVECLKAE